jgi:hypothetical protein
MLRATRVGTFSSAYDITVDGQPVTRWDASWWRSGGSFTIDGQRYDVRGNLWGSEFSMTDQSGMTVATAGKLLRREWTVAMPPRTYVFRRGPWWRHHFDLLRDGRPAGYIRRPSAWRSDTEAELSTLPLAVQIFAIGIALTVWDAAASGG